MSQKYIIFATDYVEEKYYKATITISGHYNRRISYGSEYQTDGCGR